MALDTLSVTIQPNVQWSVEKLQTGLASIPNNTQATKRFTFTKGTGALAVNDIYAAVRTLAGGANETLDLTAALTNVVGTASITVARCKWLMVWLLAAADTAPDNTTTGTACSSITVGNAASNQFTGPLGAGTHTYTVKNGAIWLAVDPGATGWVVDGTHDQLKVLNDDGAVSAKYLIAMGLGDA